MADHADNAKHIRFELRLELLAGDAFDRPEHSIPGVVHEHVNRFKSPFRGRHRLAYGFFISHVEPQRQNVCERRQGSATRVHDFGRWTLSRMGMASNERLEHYLHKFTSVEFFHQMKIPLSIVATDLMTGQSVHFTEGEIGPTLRASCAYPGLFLPVEYRGRILVDGFLTETVPAEAAREMGADIVIGVHLEPGLLGSAPRNTIEVISRSFSIIQTAAAQLWHTDVDVLIEPEVHHILWDEFVKTPQLVAAGETATRAALPKIKAALAADPTQLPRSRQNSRKIDAT